MYLIYNSRTLHITGIFREYTCMCMVYAANGRIIFFIGLKNPCKAVLKLSCLANSLCFGPFNWANRSHYFIRTL